MANDFSGDTNCVAEWRVNNGALTTDSKGTNTLNDYATVQTDTVDYKEGDASAYCQLTNTEHFYLTDAELDTGFPVKNGGTGTFSVCYWFKADSLPNNSGHVTKWDAANNERTFMTKTGSTTLQAYIGHTSGTGFELLSGTLTVTTGRWYHVGFTYDAGDKTWKFRVWDDDGGGTPAIVLNASGTATNTISVTASNFGIGAYFGNDTPANYFDGNLDEVVFFKDILSTDDIDAIRQGSYGVSAGGIYIPRGMKQAQGGII